jgi:hypothetical protein
MTKQIIDVCAYCEKDRDEVVSEFEKARLAPLSADERQQITDEALRFVLVSGNRVLLCPDDRRYPADHALAGELRPPLTEAEMIELLNAPIDLPPGISSLKHNCPMLEFDGFAEDEATFMVELRQEGNFMVGGCTECGMQVRSPIISKEATEADGEPR